MTNSPNTDGQLGMEDITLHDDILYQSCMEWESKKKRLEGAFIRSGRSVAMK